MLSFAENQERLYLVLIISVTSGVVLCLIVVVVRLVCTRRKSNDASTEQGKGGGQFKTSNTGETTITNGFSADDISEIDADIDLTTPLPMSTNANIGRNDVRRRQQLEDSSNVYWNSFINKVLMISSNAEYLHLASRHEADKLVVEFKSRRFSHNWSIELR